MRTHPNSNRNRTPYSNRNYIPYNNRERASDHHDTNDPTDQHSRERIPRFTANRALCGRNLPGVQDTQCHCNEERGERRCDRRSADSMGVSRENPDHDTEDSGMKFHVRERILRPKNWISHARNYILRDLNLFSPE